MPDKNPDDLATVVIRTKDQSYTIDSFESFDCRDSFIDPLGSYRFVVRPRHQQDFDLFRKIITRGNEVSVSINGIKQITGTIQKVTKKIDSSEGLVYDFEAQTLLAEPYRASVNPNLLMHTKTPMEIAQTIREAFKPFPAFEKSLIVISGDLDARQATVGKKITGHFRAFDVANVKHKDTKAHEGDSAYGFCQRMLSRLGLILRVNASGNLMVVRPDYDQSPLYIITQDRNMHVPGDRAFGPIVYEESNINGFSEIEVFGASLDVVGATRTSLPRAVIKASDTKLNPLYPQFRSELYPYKPLKVRDKYAGDIKLCENVCLLNFAKKAEGAFSVKCKVQGFASRYQLDYGPAPLWQPNTICTLNFDKLDIGNDHDWWILERTFRLDPKNGATTELTLLPKNCLVLGDLPQQ